MITFSILTLRNSKDNKHRIFVTFKGIEKENVDYYGLLIQRSRQLYRGFNKNKNKLKTRVLEYSFNKKKTSSKGNQTFVIEIVNATTEDCRIYASMIYSCIIWNFEFDDEVYRVKTINTNFTDIITEPDVVNEMLKGV